jgi:hypothetical protein
MKNLASYPILFILLGVSLSNMRCATLQELKALSNVDFSINRVADTNLAGLSLDSIQNYNDVKATDVLKIANAIRKKELPFAFTLHLTGENPPNNQVQARLIRLDWTLFLDEKETINGIFNDEVVLPPGTPVDIPITMQLDLYQFFGDNARDLIELALNVSGHGGGEPSKIRLTAQPSINTPLGTLRYPGTINIVNKEVGP